MFFFFFLLATSRLKRNNSLFNLWLLDFFYLFIYLINETRTRLICHWIVILNNKFMNSPPKIHHKNLKWKEEKSRRKKPLIFGIMLQTVLRIECDIKIIIRINKRMYAVFGNASLLNRSHHLFHFHSHFHSHSHSSTIWKSPLYNMFS